MEQNTRQDISITIVDGMGRSAIRRAITSTLMVVIVIGTGAVLESAAMQWMGFLFLCMAAIGWMYNQHRYSPQEAADFLRAKYGVRAGS